MGSTAPASIGPPGFGPPRERPAGPRPTETNALPGGLAAAALGVLVGGALLIRAAFGLPDDLWGRLDGGALSDGRLLAMAGGVAAGGAIAIGYGLVQRARADRAALVLCMAAAVPLAAFAAVAALVRPGTPADKQLDDPSVPYTFTYPGTWSQDTEHDMAFALEGDELWATAVSLPTEESVKQGVMVVAARVPPAAIFAWLYQPEQNGAHVSGKGSRMVAGRDALWAEYERAPGHGFRSRTVFYAGNVAFVVTCVLEREPEKARAGCEKVLDSFAFTNEDAPPGGTTQSFS
jgi:hypothetical protein